MTRYTYLKSMYVLFLLLMFMGLGCSVENESSSIDALTETKSSSTVDCEHLLRDDVVDSSGVAGTINLGHKNCNSNQTVLLKWAICRARAFVGKASRRAKRILQGESTLDEEKELKYWFSQNSSVHPTRTASDVHDRLDTMYDSLENEDFYCEKNRDEAQLSSCDNETPLYKNVLGAPRLCPLFFSEIYSHVRPETLINNVANQSYRSIKDIAFFAECTDRRPTYFLSTNNNVEGYLDRDRSLSNADTYAFYASQQPDCVRAYRKVRF